MSLTNQTAQFGSSRLDTFSVPFNVFRWWESYVRCGSLLSESLYHCVRSDIVQTNGKEIIDLERYYAFNHSTSYTTLIQLQFQLQMSWRLHLYSLSLRKQYIV